MQIIQIIPVFLPLILVVTALVWLQHSRANEILQQWAQSAGVQLVSAQKRYLRTGPMSYARGQFVFRIVVRDKAGAERTGWLRVGGWLAGVLSDKTKVIWDT